MVRTICFLFAVGILFTCSKENNPIGLKNNVETIGGDAVLSIEVEHHFENDFVQLKLNDTILLQKKITTDYTVSAAWLSEKMALDRGQYRIRVLHLDKLKEGNFEFELQDTLSVFVRFDTNIDEFKFETYKGFILRD